MSRRGVADGKLADEVETHQKHQRDWEVVIGMEVHAQVTSRSKLFSGASTAFGGEPNSHVSLSTRRCPACCL